MGVKKGTFDKTVRIVRREEKKRRKAGGAKRKLSIEKMVKMMFAYFRAIPGHIIT
ncbi:hypothetical protein AGMMS49936_04440 [Endomicrobiia bacterium]|nr:hypothetical protein AGMMS49936_04440 [Endomicrobiia bacterium]